MIHLDCLEQSTAGLNRSRGQHDLKTYYWLRLNAKACEGWYFLGRNLQWFAASYNRQYFQYFEVQFFYFPSDKTGVKHSMFLFYSKSSPMYVLWSNRTWNMSLESWDSQIYIGALRSDLLRALRRAYFANSLKTIFLEAIIRKREVFFERY